MQKKTKIILEELENLYVEGDRRLVLENRAATLIHSAVRLIEQIEREYTAEQAENLTRKFINAIRNRDADKFARSVRRTNES